MGLVRKNDLDETRPGSGFSLDLDQRACPTCRRELPPWQSRCPDDDTPTIRATDMPAADLGHPVAYEDDRPPDSGA